MFQPLNEKLLSYIRNAYVRCYLKQRGVRWRGASPIVHGGLPDFRIRMNGSIRLGSHCRLYERTSFSADGGHLVIGDRVGINSGSGVITTLEVRIGDHTRIGPDVRIMDNSFHEIEPGNPGRRGPVVIGRNVWICARAVILPSVTIGDHAVIGAGAVVCDDVPARTLVGGNPGRPIRVLHSIPDEWTRP